jgi:hypothetical protein
MAGGNREDGKNKLCSLFGSDDVEDGGPRCVLHRITDVACTKPNNDRKRLRQKS